MGDHRAVKTQDDLHIWCFILIKYMSESLHSASVIVAKTRFLLCVEGEGGGDRVVQFFYCAKVYRFFIWLFDKLLINIRLTVWK